MADDISKATKTLLENRKAEQAEFEQQQKSLEELKKQLEASGMKAEDNKEYNKRKEKFDKKQFKFRLKGATSPIARKKLKQEQKAKDKKEGGLLKSIAGGIGGILGNMKQKVKGAGKNIMGMLKGAAIAGVLAAVMAFLNSEYWIKTKAFILDKIVPAIQMLWNDYIKPIGKLIAEKLIAAWGPIKVFFSETLVPIVKTLYEDYLKPIAAIFKDSILKAWEDIKKLFSGLKKSFDLLKKVIGGVVLKHSLVLSGHLY